MTFDSVTFTARTLVRLVTLSVELFEDADPSSEDVIARSFAAQLALELDRVALRGSGTAPEPRGVLNTSGTTTTTHGANGANITNYDWLLDAAGAVLANNFDPNAHIVAPRTVTSLAKLKEATTNAYLAPPGSLLPRLPTKQIPINRQASGSTTCGTTTPRCSSARAPTSRWCRRGCGTRQPRPHWTHTPTCGRTQTTARGPPSTRSWRPASLSILGTFRGPGEG
jgi:Phage capsid family